jgi:uroporphyrin-III C-methyltransferase/precorrin-2 dehydrogenase/sirohydrochlorin ferrochelatase
MSANDKFMPIGLSLKGRTCLVVGGDLAALREVESLLEYDAAITVIASNVHEKLEYHAKRGRIALEKREYQSSEAAAYGLVVSAAVDVEVNTQVHGDASEAGVLVNVVGDLAHCNFIFPEVLRRDCLTAAISTDGKASFVSGHLRVILDNIFPAHWERLMNLAASFQSSVESRWADDPAAKNTCYSEFLEADWKKMLEELSDEQIEKELARMLEMPE